MRTALNRCRQYFSLVNRKKLLYAQCNVNAAKDIKKSAEYKIFRALYCLGCLPIMERVAVIEIQVVYVRRPFICGVLLAEFIVAVFFGRKYF